MRIGRADYELLAKTYGPGRAIGPKAYLWAKTRAYAAAVALWPEEETQFIPHPATWFNRGSYDDDPNEWVKGKPTKGQFDHAF